MNKPDIPINHASERAQYTEKIVSSTAVLKVVIAGPGTGKSYTFASVLEKKKEGPNLAFTLINNLVNDLQNDLGELAESHTFHGYCKKLLHTIASDGIDTDFHYFPKLPNIIQSDCEYANNRLNNLEDAFYSLREGDEIGFSLKRGNYYNAVGHTDAVYRVLRHFQSHAETLPAYAQVVVDEYQDFNLLEVSFIEELLKKSPILIAGDDDQAIYGFKLASEQHIRDKYAQEDSACFELPYCSRCTRVIVDAIHDVTSKAKEGGLLEGRIPKQYLCYEPDKATDSEQYPKIIHARCSTNTRKAPYIAKYIEEKILSIPKNEAEEARKKGFPCVLIAGPSHYTKQVYSYLSERFSNIDYRERVNTDITYLDAYKILLRDQVANLGWRVLLEIEDCGNKKTVVIQSIGKETSIVDLLDSAFVERHMIFIRILRKLLNDEVLSDTEGQLLQDRFSQEPQEIRNELLGDDEENSQEPDNSEISIKITTIGGSKGLSANHVFLVGMNEGQLPQDNATPTNNEVCQFIVGLTRARKQCYLISNSRFGAIGNLPESKFIGWIEKSRIDRVRVNVDYIKKHAQLLTVI